MFFAHIFFVLGNFIMISASSFELFQALSKMGKNVQIGPLLVQLSPTLAICKFLKISKGGPRAKKIENFQFFRIELATDYCSGQ